MLSKQESSALFIACSHVIIDQGGDEMYNIYCLGEPDTGVLECFGEKYDLTGDISQANVLVSFGADITEDMLGSKLIFAVLDCSYGKSKLPEELLKDLGIILFKKDAPDDSEAVSHVCDYIENGNILGAVSFPDVSLSNFGSDVSRIALMSKGFDDPILLGAMLFRGMDLKAVAGSLSGEYGYTLISSREPVTRVPHVDGILKVRVLQDI